MGETTAISWCHHTFNCWWGCVKVSPACTSCYAERDSKRYGHDVWGPNARRRFFGEKHWSEPLKWNAAAEKAGERRRVFCASMADVFEALPTDHPDAEAMATARAKLFEALIPATPWLDWLTLTKRTAAMAAWSRRSPFGRNVIAMTTAEDQEWFNKRVGDLLATRAHRRGLSLEPLLGEIDMWPWLSLQACGDCLNTQPEQDMSACVVCGSKNLRPAISWVIAGGESGPKARPTHPDWLRSLREQCAAAGVAFHFKQWGEWAPLPEPFRYSPAIGSDNSDYNHALQKYAAAHGAARLLDNRPEGWDSSMLRDGCAIRDGEMVVGRVGKKAAGRLLDGVTWDQFPAEVPRG